MSKRKVLTTVISFIGTAIFSLQDFQCSTVFENLRLDYPKLAPVFDLITENTQSSTLFFIALVSCILAMILNVVLPASQAIPIEEYLKDMHENNFPSVEETRLTVFKIRYGIRLWPYFIWNNVRYSIIHLRNRTLLHHLKSFPWRFWGKYAAFYARRGQPLEKGTLTIFNIPNKSEEINGIVSKSLFSEMPVYVKLPQLPEEAIKKAKGYNSLSSKQRKVVKDYMDKSFIRSFEQLKAIHLHSTTIAAMPILDENEKKWGVLVFDSTGDCPLNQESLTSSMNTAAIAISSIIKVVK